MSRNVGKLDQTIRYIVAIVLVVIAVIFSIWWLLIPAVILAFTASISFCGFYKIFGFNTCKYDSVDK